MAFDRQKELSLLLQCAREDGLVMVLGPQNTGKSALVNRFRIACEVDKGLKGRPIFLLDMRNPPELNGEEAAALATGVCKQEVHPIFIIDNADFQLSPARVQEMVDCLVDLGKNMRATVVLSTYVDAFRERVFTEAARLVYVGYFSEADSRAFMSQQLRGSTSSWNLSWLWRAPLLSDAEWRKIYRVCGGCPWLLIKCASEAFTSSAPQPLDAVLADMVGSMKYNVLRGFCSSGCGEKFREVMELLVQSPNGAVEWTTVRDKVFSGNEAPLRSMQVDNVIHIQYAPAPAPASGFVKFVMPISPAHLEAMRQFLAGEPESDDD